MIPRISLWRSWVYYLNHKFWHLCNRCICLTSPYIWLHLVKWRCSWGCQMYVWVHYPSHIISAVLCGKEGMSTLYSIISESYTIQIYTSQKSIDGKILHIILHWCQLVMYTRAYAQKKTEQYIGTQVVDFTLNVLYNNERIFVNDMVSKVWAMVQT